MGLLGVSGPIRQNFVGGLPIEQKQNKNCFEIFMAKEMGLDRAPIEFQTFFYMYW